MEVVPLAFAVDAGEIDDLVKDVDKRLLKSEVKYAYVFSIYKAGEEGYVRGTLDLMMDREIAFGFDEEKLTVEIVAGAVFEFATTPGVTYAQAIALLKDGRTVEIRYVNDKLEFVVNEPPSYSQE